MAIRTREQLGAASGLVVAILFGVSFVIGLSPAPPDMSDSAVSVATFVSQNQDAIRVEVLLNTLAMFAFLWFLGSVRAGLRGAEAGAGRVSGIASGGGIVGASFVILANVFAAVAALRPGETDPGITRALVDLQAISIGLGAAAFAVFFFAVAAAALYDGGLPRVVGLLAALAGLAALVGVVTIFTTDGVFAADGAFGLWVRYAAFVAWVAVASVMLLLSPPAARRGATRTRTRR
jgi:hypothetical protein